MKNEIANGMNIEENNKGFNVSIDIPGVSKDQVSLTYSKGKLTVSGNFREISHEKFNARNARKPGFFGTKMGHFLSDFLLN